MFCIFNHDGVAYQSFHTCNIDFTYFTFVGVSIQNVKMCVSKSTEIMK